MNWSYQGIVKDQRIVLPFTTFRNSLAVASCLTNNTVFKFGSNSTYSRNDVGMWFGIADSPKPSHHSLGLEDWNAPASDRTAAFALNNPRPRLLTKVTHPTPLFCRILGGIPHLRREYELLRGAVKDCDGLVLTFTAG